MALEIESQRTARHLVTSYLVATFAIAAVVGAGLALRVRVEAYQLLTTVTAWTIRRWLQRLPVRTAWVDAPAPPQLGGRADIIFMLGGVLGLLLTVQSILRAEVARAAEGVLLVVGAWGLAYAVSLATRRQRWLALASAGGGIALGIFVYAPEVAVVASSGVAATRAAGTAAVAALTYLPVGFTVEEVVFRGVMFPALRRDSRWSAVVAALYSSLLWGVWHYPVVDVRGLRSFAVLVALHVAVGGLFCWLRVRGRGLLPCACAHALLDAVRDGVSA